MFGKFGVERVSRMRGANKSRFEANARAPSLKREKHRFSRAIPSRREAYGVCARRRSRFSDEMSRRLDRRCYSQKNGVDLLKTTRVETRAVRNRLT